MISSDGPIVCARQLSKRYGEFLAVDHIDFEIARRECFGLLGPNGAGKSTTIKMLHCFYPPSGGTLELFGLDADSHAREIKAQLGVCGQEPSLDPDLTVFENLLVFARYFDIPKKLARQRGQELLDFIALSHKRNDTIVSLSGGMKRRLQIARALINDPELIVLDEPTTGLDPQSRHQVWDRIERLKRHGKTILLTTHYMDEAAALCDRLVIMDHGKILEAGSPQQLIERHVGGSVIEIPEPSPEVLAELERRGASFERTAARVLIYTANAEESLRDVAEWSHAGACTLRAATLEDVFLKLTGRELRE